MQELYSSLLQNYAQLIKSYESTSAKSLLISITRLVLINLLLVICLCFMQKKNYWAITYTLYINRFILQKYMPCYSSISGRGIQPTRDSAHEIQPTLDSTLGIFSPKDWIVYLVK